MSVRAARLTTSFSRPLKPETMDQVTRGLEEQNGDAAGWDVVDGGVGGGDEGEVARGRT